MENKSTKLDRVIKISIIAGALIIALAVAYYLVVYIPKKDNEKIKQQKQEQTAQSQEKETRAYNLNNCLEKNRENQLNTNLGFVEMQKKGEISNASLNKIIDENNKRVEKEEINCFKKYPQN